MGVWGTTGYRINEHTEQELEECVAANLHLISEGLELVGRQVGVGVGIVDILARGDDNSIAIIELKRNVIDCDAVGQLLRYMRAIGCGLEVVASRRAADAPSHDDDVDPYFNILNSDKFPVEINGYLVAPEIKTDAKILIHYLNNAEPYWTVNFKPIRLIRVPSLEEQDAKPIPSREQVTTAADLLDSFVPPVEDLLDGPYEGDGNEKASVA